MTELDQVYIYAVAGKAKIALVLAEPSERVSRIRAALFAHNWRELEDAARAAILAQGGDPDEDAVYSCPPDLAAQAVFGEV